MSYQVRYTEAAKEDLLRLYGFLVEQDLATARKALDAIRKGVEFLQDFPFTCRKATPEDSLLREMIIPFWARAMLLSLKLRTTKRSQF